MSQLNFEQARFNMVQQQIRPWEVLDQQVLDQISEVPREEFVPTVYRNLAFADTNIPLVHQQVMMSPKLEGRLLQSAMLQQTDRVLEIGTGSGYLTALLSKCVNHVETVDIFEDLVKEAESKLNAFQIKNATLNTGDAINGWKTDIHYDVIILTGSMPVLQPHFQQQLTVNGRLLAIVGEDPIMEAQLITRLSEYEFLQDSLFETTIPSLVGAPIPSKFML